VAGLDALYPLTTAAEHFFARVGFVRVARAAVPPRIAGTLELASDCPASVTTARTLEGATPLPRPAAEHPAA
jgi:N-acetylglutamate synthase-like GNAT family acetyltransferase